MRMMLKVSIPVDAGNRAITDGSLPKVIGDALGELKPEAAYFATDNGLRTAFLVFDMRESSQIPVIAERFFMGLNATVDFRPVMNAEDLQAGLQKAAEAR